MKEIKEHKKKMNNLNASPIPFRELLGLNGANAQEEAIKQTETKESTPKIPFLELLGLKGKKAQEEVLGN